MAGGVVEPGGPVVAGAAVVVGGVARKKPRPRVEVREGATRNGELRW